MNIAITGANSSVGIILLRHIAERDDINVMACVRSQPAVATLPQSPRITPSVIAYADLDTLTPVLIGVSCLVHLAGILIERATSNYQTANVDATQAVVDACTQANVPHLVLISVVGADRRSPNAYFSSKGEAERVVAESGMSATIIRTPILLGPGTAGARSLVGAASRESVKVLGGGYHSVRPLDVDDLSQAILHCCRVRADGVAIHELAGPQPTTYRDLITRTARLMGHEVSIHSIPVWPAKLAAAIVSRVQQGGITPTVIDVITADEVVHQNADVDLGVTLTALSATVAKLLPTRNRSYDRTTSSTA